jgi:hypothetical protein
VGWGCRAEHLALLSEKNQRSDGMRGKLSQGWGRWRWRDQAGGRMGKTPPHGVAGGDEDIAHAVGARAGREQHDTATAERMAGVCDLDCRRIVYRWVVDRGIKVFDRLIVSTTTLCSGNSTRALPSGNTSMPGSQPVWSTKGNSSQPRKGRHKAEPCLPDWPLSPCLASNTCSKRHVHAAGQPRS